MRKLLFLLMVLILSCQKVNQDVILENNLTNKLYEGTLSGEEFSGYVNELAVIDWAKDKFKKAKEKVKELGNDALDTLDGYSEFLLKIGGNIMKIPKMIGDVLAGAMKTSWEWIKKAVYAGKNAAFEKEDANEVAEKFGISPGTVNNIKRDAGLSKTRK